MDDINRKRLEWMANAKVGEIFPNELFGPIDPYGNGWGPAVTAAIKDALAEIDRLNALIERG